LCRRGGLERIDRILAELLAVHEIDLESDEAGGIEVQQTPALETPQRQVSAPQIEQPLKPVGAAPPR